MSATSMRWDGGGTAQLDLDLDYPRIVSTPHGYLATIYLDPQADEPMATLCISADLVHWRSPTASEFVNLGRDPFEPIAQLAASRGYAAETAGSGQGDDSMWWSADGVRWQEGIPDDVTITEPLLAASAGGCDGVEDGSGCMAVSGLRLTEVISDSARDTYVSRDGGAHWSKAKLPPHVGDLYELQHPSGGPFVAIGELFPSGPCPGGCVYADELPSVLLTSSDGVTWLENSRSDLGGGGNARILAVGNALYLLGEAGVSLSTDGCKTWTEMADDSGNNVAGDELAVAGSHVVVLHQDVGFTIDWIGTPQG